MLSSFVQEYNTDEIIIPCGQCVTVDYTDGSMLTFANGINIHGKLYFPSSAHVEFYTTNIFVQGILEMEAPTQEVMFRFFGTQDRFLFPMDANAGQCHPLQGCNLGKKALAVAGGKFVFG